MNEPIRPRQPATAVRDAHMRCHETREEVDRAMVEWAFARHMTIAESGHTDEQGKERMRLAGERECRLRKELDEALGQHERALFHLSREALIAELRSPELLAKLAR